MTHPLRRVALVFIPFCSGLGLLALAWSTVVQWGGDAQATALPLLPAPFLSTQPGQTLLSGVAPVTSLADSPTLTLADAPYQHPSGAFAIDYPADWQLDESEDSVQFTAPEDLGQFSVTFIAGETLPDGDYEQDLRSTWGDLPGFALQSSDSAHLPDRWSATFTYSQTLLPDLHNVQFTGLIIYLSREPLLYIFTASIADPGLSQISPVIQSIANSLQTYPNSIITDSE